MLGPLHFLGSQGFPLRALINILSPSESRDAGRRGNPVSFKIKGRTDSPAFMFFF
jgi:hypothetical protein